MSTRTYWHYFCVRYYSCSYRAHHTRSISGVLIYCCGYSAFSNKPGFRNVTCSTRSMFTNGQSTGKTQSTEPQTTTAVSTGSIRPNYYEYGHYAQYRTLKYFENRQYPKHRTPKYCEASQQYGQYQPEHAASICGVKSAELNLCWDRIPLTVRVPHHCLSLIHI